MIALSHYGSGLPPVALAQMESRADAVAALMRTLSHPSRLMLVCTLVEGERSVGWLETQLGIAQPTLSQQLTVLKRAGLVATRRVARQIFYRLMDAKAAQVVAALHAIYCSGDQD